jgi:CheY-like chemotaxis protein
MELQMSWHNLLAACADGGAESLLHGAALNTVASGSGSQVQPEAKREKTAMLSKKHKILVVDDERAIAEALAMILEHRGYETAKAYSGEEAIQVACSFQPDCIVSDVVMGELNGINAAMEILGVLPQCKVLFISGNVPCQDVLENAIAKGFDFEVLAKPVPVPELLARIAQMLSLSAAAAEG